MTHAMESAKGVATT